jgi:hypothetical protein
MAWTPTLPAEPRSDRWWHDVWIYQQEAVVADARRAERIERLRARAHQVDMMAARSLSADRWERIQRRRDQRDVRSHRGFQVDSWGARPEVEHSAPIGRVLSVR